MRNYLTFALTVIFICFWTLPLCAKTKTITNKIGMTFVYIPPGSFMMGSPKSEPGRQWHEKQHRVTISKGFYMGETEVTQEQWNKLAYKISPAAFSSTGEGQLTQEQYDRLALKPNPSAFRKKGGTYPVDSVSWNDCLKFIDFLNKSEGTSKYRLPTEAEWEYACRAGSTTAFSNGPVTVDFSCSTPEKSILDMAWYCYNSGLAFPARNFEPHPVKVLKPNAWGLYDMHGNVQEWVADACKQRNFWRTRVGVITDTYKNNIVDPVSKMGDHRIIRGGGWYQTAKYQRSAYRSLYKPDTRRNSLGFRIVRMQ